MLEAPMYDYFLYLTIGAILVFTIGFSVVSLGITKREQPPHDR